MEKLLECFDNDANISIVKLSHSKIKSTINDILVQLQFNRDELKNFHKKLKGYRHVDDLQNIQTGRYIRWINLKKSDLKLTNGGFITDIKILDEGIHINCKNNINRVMQIKLDENIIFQKITDQEQIILNAIKYLELTNK